MLDFDDIPKGLFFIQDSTEDIQYFVKTGDTILWFDVLLLDLSRMTDIDSRENYIRYGWGDDYEEYLDHLTYILPEEALFG